MIMVAGREWTEAQRTKVAYLLEADLFHDHPQVSLSLLELMARRLSDAEDRLADAAYKSVPARIATTLLRLAGEDNDQVRLSHQDIADMVGTYRETTTRILNELRTEGLIDLKRMQISVVDVEAVRKIANEAV